jgi:hypothetical protein
MTDFLEQAAIENERSPKFRARIDNANARAAGEHRGGYSLTTGPLTDYSWSELPGLAASRSENGRWIVRRHVEEYQTYCRMTAWQCLHATGVAQELVAERIHELVRGEGYRVDVSGLGADRPWPTGPTASSLAAVIAGASWSGATAQRQLSRRHRANVLTAADYQAAHDDFLRRHGKRETD